MMNESLDDMDGDGVEEDAAEEIEKIFREVTAGLPAVFPWACPAVLTTLQTATDALPETAPAGRVAADVDGEEEEDDKDAALNRRLQTLKT